MMKVVVLIPTYNEIENIELLLERLIFLRRENRKYEVEMLVVDDNSPDGTGRVVLEYSKKHKFIHLLSGKKEGLGRAMARGYKYAIGHMGADVVLSNEADFAFDFEHFGYMLEKIEEGFDAVIGSRHVGIGKTEGWTTSRRFNHWVANYVFATLLAGVREVYDHNGAFRAIRVRGVLEKIDWDKMPVKGFAFFFYSLYELTKITDKIDEFPVVYTFRERGESKVSFNPKYIRTYLRDISEYAALAAYVRAKKWGL